jgi:hypothetical protein
MQIANGKKSAKDASTLDSDSVPQGLAPGTSDLLRSALEFLAIRPWTILEGLPNEDGDTIISFYNCSLTSFVACVVGDDDRIRELMSIIGRKFMSENVTTLLQKRHQTGNVREFHYNFWRST